MHLDRRVALVTGAASGMGRAVALRFAAEGARVVLVDLNADGGKETEQLVAEDGGTAAFVAADVSEAEAMAAAVTVAVERYGGLDAAVNAAAVEFEVAPLHECSVDDYDRMLRINLRGVFLSMKYELAAMVAAGRPGSIVNIASTNSFRPQPNQPAYTASKHGVLGLTRSAAVDYGPHGIRVNAICPGGIETPMLLDAMARRGRDPKDVADRLSVFGRFGQPDEIAAAALWLCSDASSFTTGHALAVDGGYLAR